MPELRLDLQPEAESPCHVDQDLQNPSGVRPDRRQTEQLGDGVISMTSSVFTKINDNPLKCAITRFAFFRPLAV
jgi:hypothetical protein